MSVCEDWYHKVKCDCCGTETLAEIKGDKLVIIAKRHGRKHVAVVALGDILSRMRTATNQP